ncbi:MAG: YbaB/EbfC family nucleoid-associated protein [Pseudonocardiaceae bacterium]|nr:YbaB/EbfC family nucleoid-associated protein [Pseudonocardiaceae bacterium]
MPRTGSGVPAKTERGAPVQPGGGMPDMQQMLQQAQKMQEQLVSAQQELADAEVDGSSGGGMVTATVSGGGELKNLTIDPKVVDPQDTETLADLIVAAVRDASGNAQKLAEEKMGPLAEGLGGGQGGLPGLPGM